MRSPSLKMEKLTFNNLTTPACLIDLNVVEKNCKAMLERSKQFGINLRPHVKTHKALEIGELMTGGHKRCITVSTVAEAEFFADGGFDDILYAIPITENKIKRCQTLSERLEAFHVFVDSDYGLKCLTDNPLKNNREWSVFLKVDCGCGRAGVLWDKESSYNLAEKISTTPGINLKGLYCHCGDSYDQKCIDDVRGVSNTASERIALFKEELQKRGVNVDIFGIGSTPSASNLGEKARLVNEIHPGNYAFYDIMQVELGSCKREDIAIRIMTTVIGHYPEKGHLLIDCGELALGAKMVTLKTGLAEFQGHPNLKLANVDQEHGFVTSLDGELEYEKYPIGSKLFIYPFHSCITAAGHPRFFVHVKENIVDIWKPCRGW